MFVEIEEEDGISPWLGTAIPEAASPPGWFLAAVPVGLGTMVLATSPVVCAGNLLFLPIGRIRIS